MRSVSACLLAAGVLAFTLGEISSASHDRTEGVARNSDGPPSRLLKPLKLLEKWVSPAILEPPKNLAQADFETVRQWVAAEPKILCDADGNLTSRSHAAHSVLARFSPNQWDIADAAAPPLPSGGDLQDYDTYLFENPLTLNSFAANDRLITHFFDHGDFGLASLYADKRLSDQEKIPSSLSLALLLRMAVSYQRARRALPERLKGLIAKASPALRETIASASAKPLQKTSLWTDLSSAYQEWFLRAARHVGNVALESVGLHREKSLSHCDLFEGLMKKSLASFWKIPEPWHPLIVPSVLHSLGQDGLKRNDAAMAVTSDRFMELIPKSDVPWVAAQLSAAVRPNEILERHSASDNALQALADLANVSPDPALRVLEDTVVRTKDPYVGKRAVQVTIRVKDKAKTAAFLDKILRNPSLDPETRVWAADYLGIGVGKHASIAIPAMETLIKNENEPETLRRTVKDVLAHIKKHLNKP